MRILISSSYLSSFCEYCKRSENASRRAAATHTHGPAIPPATALPLPGSNLLDSNVLTGPREKGPFLDKRSLKSTSQCPSDCSTLGLESSGLFIFKTDLCFHLIQMNPRRYFPSPFHEEVQHPPPATWLKQSHMMLQTRPLSRSLVRSRTDYLLPPSVC